MVVEWKNLSKDKFFKSNQLQVTFNFIQSVSIILIYLLKKQELKSTFLYL